MSNPSVSELRDLRSRYFNVTDDQEIVKKESEPEPESEPEMKNSHVDCPICYEEIDFKCKDFLKTECGHDFHASCLMTSVRYSGFKCPYCQQLMTDKVASARAQVHERVPAPATQPLPQNIQATQQLAPVQSPRQTPQPPQAHVVPVVETAPFVFRGDFHKRRDPATYKRAPRPCQRCQVIGHNRVTCYIVNDITREHDRTTAFCMRCGETGHTNTSCQRDHLYSNRTQRYDRQLAMHQLYQTHRRLRDEELVWAAQVLQR